MKVGAKRLDQAPIIVAEKLVKTYKSRTLSVNALQGVDLKVMRGEMVAVMGPSGSGKTTLLNCMSGLDVLDSGRVSISGQFLAELPDDALSEYRARSMGFIFQLYNLLPVLSALENVEMPLLISGQKPRQARDIARHQLDQVGMANWADHKPSELSGGQQQRVTIARALVNEPSIVWADEPTGNLDSENANDVMNLLCRLNEENQQTFVIVTHTQEVGDMAGRIVRMRDGRIEHDGTNGAG